MDLLSTSTVSLSLVFSIFYVLPPAVSQTGFLSFDCGVSTSNYLDASTGFTWQTDGTYWPSIDNWSVSVNVTPPADMTYLNPLSTLRYFPNSKPSSNSSSSFGHIGQETKICYEMPALKDSFYLLRATFWLGPVLPEGYPAPRTAGAVSFRVIVDTYAGVLVKISVPQTSVWFEEMYVKAVGSTLTLCLSAASDSTDTPFINSLELRPLTNVMVTTKMVGAAGKALRMLDRVDFGALSSSPPLLRYPDDVFDRLWFRSTSAAANTISTNQNVSISNFDDRPPPAMLQTCYVASTLQGNATLYNVTTASPGSKGVTVAGTHEYFINTWFSELDPRANGSGLRVFDITTDGSRFYSGLDIFNGTGKLYAPYGIYTSDPWGPFTDHFDIVALAASWSVYPPTIAGVEILHLLDDSIVTATAFTDVLAIKELIIGLNGFNFSGDPCLPSNYSYPWISCTFYDTPKVSSISLSNYNTIPGKTIPISLNDIDSLTTILLDGNALEGSIPSFSNLQKLQLLNLSNNRLNGSIPSSLAELPYLTSIDLRNNNLSGTIPSSLIDKQKKGLTLKYEGNPFLCNGTCESSFATSTKKKSQTTMIVGIVVGVAIFIIVVVFLIILCVCKRIRHKHDAVNSTSMEKYQANPVLGQTQLIELESINAHAFSFEEIVKATANFSKIIGKGGFGFVYKGTLETGLDVAIKVLSDASQQGEREFLNEVSLLSRIHHKKLVGLVGYCIDKKLILVYEYMSNGSLFDVLFGTESCILLSWMDRLCILLDAAQGLAYLHHGCSSLIIHRDVKSSNILLNESLEGKISDFGISRRKANDGGVALTTKLVGSAGYIDPQFALTLRLSEKVDVYSFGVVLLEAVSGQPPMIKDPSQPNGEVQLVEWVRFFYEKCQIEELIDYRFGGYNVESIWKVIELAMACVEFQGERRPTMNEVYNELLEAARLESNSIPLTITSNYTTSVTNTGEGFLQPHVHAR